MSIPWTSTVRPLLFLLLTLGVALTGRAIIQVLPDRPSPQWIATGLTLDLVLGIPFLYWLLLVRGSGWPRRTLLPVVLLSVVLANQLIPEEYATLLRAIHLLAIPVEVLLLVYVITKAVRAVRLARRRMHEQTDAWLALRSTARELLGASRFADIAAFEVAMPYFAFFARRARLDAHTFSVDREVGYGGLFFLLMLAVGVEVVVVHLIVASLGGNVAAWVITALGIYGGIWLLADYGAIRNRAVVLGESFVTLRVGFRWEVRVPYSMIEAIRPFDRSEPKDDRMDLSVFGDPKLVLQLEQPVRVEGLYGIRRTVSRLGLRVDQQDVFVAALQKKLEPPV